MGVDRLQALATSHGASTMSRVAGWAHWPQAQETFLIAVLIGWVSILWGFHHKGRPFGSRKARALAIAIIVGTAIIAGFLSIFVPHLPLSIGIFVPALLCGAALREKGEEEELRAVQPQLAAIVTLGIAYMLKKLTQQTIEDCATWGEDQVDALRIVGQDGVENEVASLGRFTNAAWELRNKLRKRCPEDIKVQVVEHLNDFNLAVSAARKAHDAGQDEKFSQEYNMAEEELSALLQLAWNWNVTNIDFTVTPKPPARTSKPPEQNKVP